MNEANENDRAKATEILYTTVFSQAFSPCGKFLVAGNNFGKISVFSLVSSLSPNSRDSCRKAIFQFKAHNGPVYSLISTDKFLISAGTGSIKGWNWTELLKKAPKVAWALDIPANVRDQVVNPETNSLALCEVDGVEKLYAGCGDNMIHSWDISSGTFLVRLLINSFNPNYTLEHSRSYSGHSDYIHSVCLRSSWSQFLSGSEDGSVRLWDVRTGGGAVEKIEPFKDSECARPDIGNWIGCVAVDQSEDWMVCGGGPSLSLWHLRSLSPTTVFSTPNVYINHVMYHEDMLISGGGEPFIHQWSINGESRARVPCSSTNIFNVSINNKTDKLKVLTAAGNCNDIDVCTNFGYKAFSLKFTS